MGLAQTVPADPDAFNNAIEVALAYGNDSNEAIEADLAYLEAERTRLLAVRSRGSARGTLRPVPASPLTAREAAAVLRMAKSDGEPTEAGYRVIRKIGYRAGARLYVKPDALEAFQRTGGER